MLRMTKPFQDLTYVKNAQTIFKGKRIQLQTGVACLNSDFTLKK